MIFLLTFFLRHYYFLHNNTIIMAGEKIETEKMMREVDEKLSIKELRSYVIIMGPYISIGSIFH